MLNVWIHTFAHDKKIHIALLLIGIDLIVGVAAALKGGTFRLSYLADFMRNDILGKLIPYFVLYVLALVSGGTNIVIPGLDFGFLAGAAYATLVAAIGASIIASIRHLGLPGVPLTTATVLGGENTGPPKA